MLRAIEDGLDCGSGVAADQCRLLQEIGGIISLSVLVGKMFVWHMLVKRAVPRTLATLMDGYARTPGVNLHGIQVPQYAHLLPDILVWYAIVVLVNHDVIGTGQFHLLAISEAVWSHGQFAQRRVLFRLEDVTSASPCRSGRLFIEAVHQLIDTGIHTR